MPSALCSSGTSLSSSSGTSFLSLGVLVLAAALLLGGCSSSSRTPATSHYRQPQNEMVYRARGINLGTLFSSGGMSRDPNVELNSWATCNGKNCRPRRAWFGFVLRSSGRTQVLSNREVEIQTAQDLHRWPESRKRFGAYNESSSNELTRIRMKMSTLRDIAQSKGRVKGTLGNKDFSLTYEERAPLRALLKKIGNASRQSQAS